MRVNTRAVVDLYYIIYYIIIDIKQNWDADRMCKKLRM